MIDELQKYYKCGFDRYSLCDELQKYENCFKYKSLQDFRKRLDLITNFDVEIETKKIAVHIGHSLCKARRQKGHFLWTSECNLYGLLLTTILEEELLRVAELADIGVGLAIYLRQNKKTGTKLIIQQINARDRPKRTVVILRSSIYFKYFRIELHSRTLSKVKTVFSEDSIKKIKKFLSSI